MPPSPTPAEPDPAAADPLGALIALLRPQTVLSKVVSGRGAWSVRYARYEDPAFCLILEGSCLLDADGLGRLELQEGDVVVFPETPGFTIGSGPGVVPTPVSPTSTDVEHGPEAEPVTLRLLGGYFRFDRTNAPLLVRLLPPVLHIRRQDPGASRLRRLVELIVDEADAERPGRDPILERLVEVLLVEALRFRPASEAPQEAGLLAGLADPALARALREIHADVARPWTVATLARTAGLSRAVFAERYARTVGLPPIEYLLEWRMALARDLLRREHLPLVEVAERVGYQSASAFSTAFTRLTGRPPRAFARQTDRDAGPGGGGAPDGNTGEG